MQGQTGFRPELNNTSFWLTPVISFISILKCRPKSLHFKVVTATETKDKMHTFCVYFPQNPTGFG